MKRNRFGINLDEGIPLESYEDYEILFVDCFREAAAKLRLWFEQEDAPPVLVGGQIGSGKSTLIAKAIGECNSPPDVTLHFDRESTNLDIGDFLAITLAGLIDMAIRTNADLSHLSLPQELGQEESADWRGLLEGLRPKVFNMQSFSRRTHLRKNIAENRDYFAQAIVEMGKQIERSLGRSLVVFASGIDKFSTKEASSLAVNDIVALLSTFKTLFEVNAVHLFSKPGSSFHVLNRIFVPTAEEGAILEILSKRMGIYAKGLEKQLADIAGCSGGNPRQALRLLSHFVSAGKNKDRSGTEKLAFAIRETRSDFFSYAAKPSAELMKLVKGTGKIGSALFSLPGDRETAGTALYGNWIFLQQSLGGDGWRAIPNPLVGAFFEHAFTPEDPEMQILRRFSETHDVSPSGLGLSRIDEKTGKVKTSDQLLWEYLFSGVELPIHCNLTEVLDVLGAALLSRERADRAIIAFKDKGIIDAARSYLFAKANTFEYQRLAHIVVKGGVGQEPLAEIDEFLSGATDIYSMEFEGEWYAQQLDALDKRRDTFIAKQILWWISLDDLKSYLPHWTQLRQLFEVFVLEDELLGSISAVDLEADLAFFSDLVEAVESSEGNLVSNLRKVLRYLHHVGRGGEDGQ